MPSWMKSSRTPTTNTPTITPPSSIAAVPKHTHQAQFYNDDYHLVSTISSYLGPLFDESYEDGTSAVIIARPRLIRHLKDQFVTRGYRSEFGDTNQDRTNELLNLFDASTNKGRHVLFIDAYQLLGKLVPTAEINVRDFDEMMSEVLSQLPGSRKKDDRRQSLYAYGELVDILCERRQHWIAFELEELWNNLIATRHFSLLCGYRMESFQDEAVADVFQHICHSHNIVSPTESYSILDTPEDKLRMVAALQQNVTSLEAIVKRQNDLSKHGEQQKRHQEQFVDILSNELRNPVSCITGNVELLMAGLEARHAVLETVVEGRGNARPSDIASIKLQLMDDGESVDAIATCTSHMKMLTEDLVSLSRLEAGMVMLENVPFDPKETITSVIKMFAALAKKKDIQLTADLPKRDLRILGDAGRFSQIIINLLSNALKFMDKGCITVDFCQVGQRNDSSIFQVRVRDTGKGLSEEGQMWLSHPFTQPMSSSIAKYGGSGLGLYISKCLVELMGGSLQVESERGEGSTFTFTFPARQCLNDDSKLLLNMEWTTPDDFETRNENTIQTAPPEPTNSVSTCPAPFAFPDTTPSQVKHVLLVDNNPISLRVHVRLLEAAKITATTASNGYEAIGKLINLSTSKTPIDVILLELDLPFMDGVSTTRAIRKLDESSSQPSPSPSRFSRLSDVPILGMTAHTRRERFVDACLAGMDDCVEKPVPRTVLLRLIDAVFKLRMRGQ